MSDEETDETSTSLTKADEEHIDDALQKMQHIDDPLEHITPEQQKYVQMKVNTNLPKHQLGKLLGLSNYMMKKFDKNPFVQAFQKQCQKDYKQTHLQKISKQNSLLRDLAFAELWERFQEPDPDNDLDEDATLDEKKAYLERYVKNLAPDKLFRIFKELDRMKRLDDDSPTEYVEGDFVDKVKKQFAYYQKRTKRYEELKQQADDEGVESVEAYDETGQKLEAEVLPENKSSDGVIEEVEEEFRFEEYVIKNGE